MLSLNATIEAARAQEQGKAFSVVASEVRQLAETSRTAAEEISKLAGATMDVAEHASEMLAKLAPNIHKTAELVQEISAASNEQTTGVEQINKAIQQLNQVTQQNAMVSENIASAAEELAAQAEQLRQTMTFFRIAETPYQPVVASAPSPRAIASQPPVIGSGTRTERPRERLQHRPNQGDAAKGAAGYVLTMQERSEGEDDRDAEFERY